MDDKQKMKWQKDLDTFFPIYSTFILEGYVDDDQPYDGEGGAVEYCRMAEYFDRIYTDNPDPARRKRVIIYDPTESEEKRFQICGEPGEWEPAAETDEDAAEPSDGAPRGRMLYSSNLSQHFWDIVHDKDVERLLIDHRESGPSLDFSRIHYAVTEGGNRLSPSEHLEKFQEMLAAIFSPERAQSEPGGYLFVIKMTSRLLSRDGQSSGLSAEELMLFRQLLNIAQSMDAAAKGDSDLDNKLVILANQLRDLPAWFTDELANPFLKVITVARPSEENKLAFFHGMLEDPACFGADFLARFRELDAAANPPEARMRKKNAVEKKFLAYTNDFGMNMLRKYQVYLRAHPLNDPDKLAFSVSSFRAGDMTNPWDDEERIKEMLCIKETVRKKIRGQDEALDMAQDILTRAAIGLDRSKNPNAPRVVLFLAGPTGTGKTELCKQIAECIFGSEERIVRFDMSEYGQEESDQKLFGAPPGYVGYEEGGKLTNAIKKEPFSLVLFDEIEKAHNSILDKFLQILGDGRLTDGKGETVRFTDCIIVITSNAGITPMGLGAEGADGGRTLRADPRMGDDELPRETMDMARVAALEEEGRSPEEIYELVREYLRYNVKAYFYCKLGRPELYGRIEDAIVYYNFIGKDSVREIVSSTVDAAIASAGEMVGIGAFDGAAVEAVKDKIAEYCRDCRVRAMGARGIIKGTEKLFTGSLSRGLLSDYFRGKNGKSREDLRGKTLTCSCRCGDKVLSKPDDIVWEIAD